MNKRRTEAAVRRVNEMEKLLDECSEAVKDLTGQLDRMEALKSGMTKLFDYYGSEKWHADRETDEKGELPDDLKRGVLSEDLIYDVITDARDAAFKMLELGTEILRDRI